MNESVWSVARKIYYGDDVRFFVGIVESVDDPDNLGKARVRIFGIHSDNTNDVPSRDLPRAEVMVPATEPGVSGLGLMPQLKPGAYVLGVFIDGKDSQLPIIIGSIPRIEFVGTKQKDLIADVINNSVDVTSEPVSQLEKNPSFTKLENGVYTPQIDQSQNGEGADFNEDLRIKVGMKFFIDNGYTVSQAAGIMGNLIYESGLNTTKVFSDNPSFLENPDFSGEQSQGIAQWNPAKNVKRLQGLFEFASKKLPTQRDWRDYDVQLQYVLYELRRYSSFNNVGLKNTTNVSGGPYNKNNKFNSTWVFALYYERPNFLALKNSINTREKYALKSYQLHISGE